MNVHKMYLQKLEEKAMTNRDMGLSKRNNGYVIAIVICIGAFAVLLALSMSAHATWGHTTYSVFLKEWKSTEQANYHAGGPNHPYIGNYNHYGGEIDGKKGWKWSWWNTGYYVPIKFTGSVTFKAKPSGGITSDTSSAGRAPKGGLVIGSIGVSIGPWSVGIPTADYISYCYNPATLTGTWTDYRTYDASLMNSDFAFWQSMYPYSSTYNKDQKVVIKMGVVRAGAADPLQQPQPVINGYDSSSAYFVLGDNNGGDDGYIDPIWKNS